MATPTLYDHPLYYDVLFGWDRSREADFYEAAFLRAGARPGDAILEVACGTGQVARRLAPRWRVTGLDSRPAMLAFLRERTEETGAPVEVLCADMTAFSVPARFAAAYNPLSSFRLLASDAQVEAHLACMAAALRPGAVYVLDLDLAESEDTPRPTTDEAWVMTRGAVTVSADDGGVHVDDGGVMHELAWADGEHLRSYTAAGFGRLLGTAPDFELVAWHPETSRASGTSEFHREGSATPPAGGRTMVVLRRR
jgi:SAM-dependent methyltransferase